MIILKENTVVWNLLRIIALCGEYPVFSTGILGNRREYRKRICEMQDERTYRDPHTGQTATVRALEVSSFGRTKNVRLTKDAEVLLKWTGFHDAYAERSAQSGFHTDGDCAEEDHGTFEAAALFLRAGYPVETDMRRIADNTGKDAFYPARHSGGGGPGPLSPGAGFAGFFGARDSCFAVYNARGRGLKPAGGGGAETDLLPGDNPGRRTAGAILLGKDYETGLKAALGPDPAAGRIPFWRNRDRLFFAPLDANGAALLAGIPEKHARGEDAGGSRVHSFLDGDLGSLIAFWNFVCTGDENEVVCYDFQADFVSRFFRGTGTKITAVQSGGAREAVG